MRWKWLLGAVLLAWVRLSEAQESPKACTHWASPTGSGSACTNTSPCRAKTWIDSNLFQPGASLCLKDGTYTGSDSMLFVNSGKGGTETSPIWIRAENEGKVLINGQFGTRPIDCYGHDVVFWGFNARDGNDHSITVRGTRCQIKRTNAWSTKSEDGIATIVDVGGTHNLVEDVNVWGYGRKMIAAGSRGGVSGNVIRRVWVDHNGFKPGFADPGNPTDPFEIGYDQDSVTAENCIFHRNIKTSATEPRESLTVFSTRDSWIGGSIGYLQGGETFEPSNLAFLFPEGGSHAGSGHWTSRTTLTQSVFYAHPSFTHVSGVSIWGHASGTGNVVDTIVSVAPRPDDINNKPGWTIKNAKYGTTMAAAIGSGKSVWTEVPGVCKRYKNKQLTSEPLWPWPMDKRLSDALVLDGRPAWSLTATMEQLLGQIPAECRSGSVPPEPPEIWLDVQLTAPQAGATVSGSQVKLTAVVNTSAEAVLGVQFKIDGLSVGAEDTERPFEYLWDSTSVADGDHTVSAVARVSGKTASADPVTIAVDNAGDLPLPPGLTSFSCTGQSGPGVFTMNCTADPAQRRGQR